MIELPVRCVNGAAVVPEHSDLLAVEEPLEIRIGFVSKGARMHQSISITMRTPGDDFALAAGFLFTESIISSADQIEGIRHCGKPAPGSELRNTVRVDLQSDVTVDLKRLERHFYTSSSCGVCGKTSIEALQMKACPVLRPGHPLVATSIIHQLPETLRTVQSVFDSTGGLHAAALFDRAGKLIAVCEDVGRHNALDKVIGKMMLERQVPLHDGVLLVSGRASFELVQKALMAGIPMLAAVGAPSSLAVQLAGEFGLTLLGFVRDGRFNIYTGESRIRA